MDLLVEDLVAIEVKAIEKLIEVHRAQLLTYLRFADLQIGLLLNFNVQQLKHGGIVRVVNGLRE
jgi:GxxExxY protein